MGTEGLFKKTVRQSGTCQITGGGKRDRTADLLHAMQALSQLSYTPCKMNANYTELPSLSQCKAALRNALSQAVSRESLPAVDPCA